MDSGVTHLSAERHYMGSASSGRYRTDPNRRPDYNRLPDAETLERRAAAQPAWKTRYLREQHVAALVLDCQDAREIVDEAVCALQEATPGQVPLAQAYLKAATDRRRELSRNLRLLGISPLEQAAILREAQARLSRLEAKQSA